MKHDRENSPDFPVEFHRMKIDAVEHIVIAAPLCGGEQFHELSSAEKVVVEAAVAGATNLEIAKIRGTSERTVANQLASAYQKLGVSSRSELTRLLGAKSG